MNPLAPLFLEGAIPYTVITACMQQYATDKTAGAYSCFLGQVRNDEVNGMPVTAISYTAYVEMANDKMREIARAIQQQFQLKAIEVKHSLGIVKTGEVCLFVLTVATHRKAAMQACDLLVERIKAELPIWGKELMDNDNYQWKINQ